MHLPIAKWIEETTQGKVRDMLWGFLELARAAR